MIYQNSLEELLFRIKFPIKEYKGRADSFKEIYVDVLSLCTKWSIEFINKMKDSSELLSIYKTIQNKINRFIETLIRNNKSLSRLVLISSQKTKLNGGDIRYINELRKFIFSISYTFNPTEKELQQLAFLVPGNYLNRDLEISIISDISDYLLLSRKNIILDHYLSKDNPSLNEIPFSNTNDLLIYTDDLNLFSYTIKNFQNIIIMNDLSERIVISSSIISNEIPIIDFVFLLFILTKMPSIIPDDIFYNIVKNFSEKNGSLFFETFLETENDLLYSLDIKMFNKLLLELKKIEHEFLLYNLYKNPDDEAFYQRVLGCKNKYILDRNVSFETFKNYISYNCPNYQDRFEFLWNVFINGALVEIENENNFRDNYEMLYSYYFFELIYDENKNKYSPLLQEDLINFKEKIKNDKLSPLSFLNEIMFQLNDIPPSSSLSIYTSNARPLWKTLYDILFSMDYIINENTKNEIFKELAIPFFIFEDLAFKGVEYEPIIIKYKGIDVITYTMMTFPYGTWDDIIENEIYLDEELKEISLFSNITSVLRPFNSQMKYSVLVKPVTSVEVSEKLSSIVGRYADRIDIYFNN